MTCDVCHCDIDGTNLGQSTAEDVICLDCLNRLKGWTRAQPVEGMTLDIHDQLEL